MTDPRTAQPGSYWTSARSNRPDAAGPAGWFPPPAGEAAPPVRFREPARWDAASKPGPPTPYDVETRPTAMYRVPWEAARKHRGGPGSPAPRPAPADPRADAPDMAWPALARRGPRHIPVVGPTEALSGRAGGHRADVPSAPAPAPPGQEGQSGWQRAQRAWQESGVDWEETAPGRPDDELPAPYAPAPYAPAPYALGGHALNTYPDFDYPDDDYPDGEALEDAAPESTDPHATRADLPGIPASGDSRLGIGPWPVQPPEDRAPEDRAPEDRAPEDQAPEDQAPEVQAAQDAPPPLPRRVRPRAFAQSSAFAPSSPFTPSSSFTPASSFTPSSASAPRQSSVPSPSLAPSAAPGTTRPPAAAPLSAPVAAAAPPLGESDELFRAWQGSVREAADRSPWSPRRRPVRGRAAQGRAGGRGLGWQVAKIGVPAAVIVTVGAGALLMLTGRANEMLAARASTGPASSGQAGAASTGSATAAAAGLTLAGYPGQHGSAGVAALWSAGGTTMAAGSADGHPAVWRHATSGAWSLVSAAALGGLTGHLTSVGQGPAGWIAVGSMNAGGTAAPMVLGSPDGVTWTRRPALTRLAGSNAQFLGVAAGPGGYLVVGKQGSGSRERAAFWWSGDMKNWVSASGTGAPSYAAAAVAMNGGFVAVGSMANCHTIWLSADGRHWTKHDLAKPHGATTASLRSVAAGPGGRFVAAGFATSRAGDIPIVVSSADGGVHVTQAVLSVPQGPATVTAVTATNSGFVAAGLVGAGKAQRAVEWTSPDGVTWSAATPVNSAGTDEITALTDGGSTVTGTAKRGAGPSVVTVPVK